MPGNTNFRKILLNRCQKEFEKEKLDDIQMEQKRNKTFENVSWIYSLCSAFKFSLALVMYVSILSIVELINVNYLKLYVSLFLQEEEKKEFMEKLDNIELKNRRRTLGYIRFIGELFKLKVGNIYHHNSLFGIKLI